MQPLHQIRMLLPALPEKDFKICSKYLENRRFQDILEIVESDIYKLRKTFGDTEEDYFKQEAAVENLENLRYALIEYISYIYIDD